MQKILYIDDEVNGATMDSKLDIIKADLRVDFIKVDSVQDAMETVHKVIDSISLIILDIIMPPERTFSLQETKGGTTTGLALLKQIRAAYPKIEIMIISVRRKDAMKDIIKKYRVAEFLEKPILAASIESAIRKLIFKS